MQATIELIEPLPSLEQQMAEIEADMREQDEHDRITNEAFADKNTGYCWHPLIPAKGFRRSWVRLYPEVSILLRIDEDFDRLFTLSQIYLWHKCQTIEQSFSASGLLSLVERRYS